MNSLAWGFLIYCLSRMYLFSCRSVVFKMKDRGLLGESPSLSSNLLCLIRVLALLCLGLGYSGVLSPPRLSSVRCPVNVIKAWWFVWLKEFYDRSDFICGHDLSDLPLRASLCTGDYWSVPVSFSPSFRFGSLFLPSSPENGFKSGYFLYFFDFGVKWTLTVLFVTPYHVRV